MSIRQKKRCYNSFSDDFVQTSNQQYKLPHDYKWVKTSLVSRIFSAVIYALALFFSNIYCRVFLHVRFKNKRVLKQARSGAFLYCNHTQPVGDAFIPALACFPSRIYTVISPSNFGIPIIGKILPFLGALPVSDSFGGTKKLMGAIRLRLIQKSCIVIFPEAHVWEYYTGIRPFSPTSFKLPARFEKPVFCMTSTYQKRRFFKRPRITVYVDGPFYPQLSSGINEQAVYLRNAVYECMKKRSRCSNYDYIRYERAK